MITNEIQTKMNYYELAKEIHANAVDKGFHDKQHSNEHCFMLAITEASEAVQSHRRGLTASVPDGIEDFPDKAFIPSFELHIKDTVEDELADTAIRLLDIYGSIIEKEEDTPDITEQVDEGYMSSLDLVERPGNFTEWAYELTRQLSRNDTIWNPLQKVFDGLCLLLCISEYFDIDLDRHILLKVRYNATRPRLHGKKY